MRKNRSLILVVDDEDDARAELRSLLEANGFVVEEAHDGRKALNYLTSDQPDPSLILLDLRMPEMSGWELMSILKSYTRLAAIPVVVMSAHDPYREALPPGAFSHYLRKPIAPDQLFETVRDVVGAAH